MSQDSSALVVCKQFKNYCTTADTSIASGEFLMLSQLVEDKTYNILQKEHQILNHLLCLYVKGNASATYVDL